MRKVGIDTNVLLRLIVTDDPRQYELAKAFFAPRAEATRFVVSVIVLVELFWTLRSRYRLSSKQCLDAMTAIVDREDFEIENADVVALALSSAREGAGFSDALVALSNISRGCEVTATFDRHAARTIPSMTLLA